MGWIFQRGKTADFVAIVGWTAYAVTLVYMRGLMRIPQVPPAQKVEIVLSLILFAEMLPRRWRQNLVVDVVARLVAIGAVVYAAKIVLSLVLFAEILPRRWRQDLVVDVVARLVAIGAVVYAYFEPHVI